MIQYKYAALGRNYNVVCFSMFLVIYQSIL